MRRQRNTWPAKRPKRRRRSRRARVCEQVESFSEARRALARATRGVRHRTPLLTSHAPGARAR